MWRETGQQTSVCRGMRRRGRAQAGEKGCGVSEKIRACVNNHTFSVHCVWVREVVGSTGRLVSQVTVRTAHVSRAAV